MGNFFSKNKLVYNCKIKNNEIFNGLLEKIDFIMEKWIIKKNIYLTKCIYRYFKTLEMRGSILEIKLTL